MLNTLAPRRTSLVLREQKAQPSTFPTDVRDGTFEGYASLFDVMDQSGDIVRPGAFRSSLRRRGVGNVKLLYQHDAREPIGLWLDIREDGRGLFVRGRVLDQIARGREVLTLMREGVLDGLSIGFQILRARKERLGVRSLIEIDLWEISLVTFPMLTGARVARVKRAPRTVLSKTRSDAWRAADAVFKS
ncbi:MAG: HK97 family phage prohead protease [Pseudorhodoplanes sp.]